MSARNAGWISAMSGLNHVTSFEGLGTGGEAAVDAMIASMNIYRFQSSSGDETVSVEECVLELCYGMMR